METSGRRHIKLVFISSLSVREGNTGIIINSKVLSPGGDTNTNTVTNICFCSSDGLIRRGCRVLGLAVNVIPETTVMNIC